MKGGEERKVEVRLRVKETGKGKSDHKSNLEGLLTCFSAFAAVPTVCADECASSLIVV